MNYKFEKKNQKLDNKIVKNLGGFILLEQNEMIHVESIINYVVVVVVKEIQELHDSF